MSVYNETEAPDAAPTMGVKLFVGQIPREMDEDALIPYFNEFGPIVELTVIRDRATRIHKGCAFVTYLQAESAHQAIEHLHDKIKLGHAINPLQVRIAECQVERENKLFIGMLPKTVTEEQLHDMFVKFGDLREVHIIRGPEGSSKGCAFVKFVERESALYAIEEMNNKVPEGSTRPLVIKFADVKKHGKKIDSSTEFLTENIANMSLSREAPYWLHQPTQQNATLPSTAYYYPPYDYSHGGGIPLPQQIMQSYIPYANQSMQNVNPYLVVTPGYGNRNHMTDGSKDPSLYGQQQRARDIPTEKVFPSRTAAPIAERYVNPTMTPSSSSHRLEQESEDSPPSPTRPPEGPSGANLFIYHLPRDLTDADLATLFAPFGNVISAKVFVDKKTSDSKGFGFVSYDSIESADASIASMNGFQIGTKRLKVQHKRTGEDPYSPSMPPQESYSLPTMQNLPSTMEVSSGQFNGFMPNHLQDQQYLPIRPIIPNQLVPTNQMMGHQYGYRQTQVLSYPNNGRSRVSSAASPYPFVQMG